jgi:hypothetical protein
MRMTNDDIRTTEETVRALLCKYSCLTALSESGADAAALAEALEELCAQCE